MKQVKHLDGSFTPWFELAGHFSALEVRAKPKTNVNTNKIPNNFFISPSLPLIDNLDN
jgi:hypothetical protein